jgi:DNA modification methylase
LSLVPYYNQDNITIYHGDNREIMPQMPRNSFDLILADPPYPELKGGVEYLNGGVAERITVSKSVGTPWETSLDWMTEAWSLTRLGMMTFCSYHSVDTVKQKLRDNAIALITWYKRNTPNPVNNVPKFTTEFIWLFKKAPGLIWRNLETMYDMPMPFAGCFATERILERNSKKAAHPTQKPIALITRLLAVQPLSVLDPFMGTGTTLRAALNLGIEAVGIEIEEHFCEMTAERLRQLAMNLTKF